MNLFSKKSETEVPQSAAEDTQQDIKDSDEGLLGKLKSGLSKTHNKITTGLRSVLRVGRNLDEELIEEIEEQLYIADIGPRTVMELREKLDAAYKEGTLQDVEDVIPFLEKQMKEELREWDTQLNLPEEGPAVILVVGVNGSGKTTSIGKLAHRLHNEGKKVLLAASDTFRAAAVEQLSIWADWTNSDIVKNESADPAAVAFDAMDKAMAGNYDVLIVDTAGRVHTRKNLMSELQKISRVITKKMPDAPHESLMVLDATTGQNAVSQALRFSETLEVTGIVLTKLDGTAKGGIVFGMRDQVNIPVKFIGIGQQAEDLAEFDADKFVEALFE